MILNGNLKSIFLDCVCVCVFANVGVCVRACECVCFGMYKCMHVPTQLNLQRTDSVINKEFIKCIVIVFLLFLLMCSAYKTRTIVYQRVPACTWY